LHDGAGVRKIAGGELDKPHERRRPSHATPGDLSAHGALSLGFRPPQSHENHRYCLDEIGTRVGAGLGRQLSAGGPAGTMIEPDCHHDHASSVQ